MIYSHITEVIGNTPLLKIDESVHGIKNLELYAKLEYMNPFGSVKDRSVWGMLKNDLQDIKDNGKRIVEMSSGNTAKAIQGIAGTFGVDFKTITNRIKVDEVRDILVMMGTEIEELPGNSDCHDPNDPNDPLVYIHKEIEKDPNGTFFTSQYDNQKNVEEHYNTTGEEILRDLDRVDYYFAGLGTTGSSLGPGLKIKERDANLQVHGIVADKHDYIPGIRTIDELYEVGLLNPSFYQDIHNINSQVAIDGMLNLIRKSGVMSGPTGGAVYAAILKYFKKNPPVTKTKAVFVVCDRAEWYVSYVKKRRPDVFGQAVVSSWKDDLKDDESVSIDAESLNKMLESDKETMLVDIRNQFAFRASHVHRSINLPYEYIDDMFAHKTNPFNMKKPVVFVCPIGEKSESIAKYLKQKGVDAYSLESGITAWRDAGFGLDNSF